MLNVPDKQLNRDIRKIPATVITGFLGAGKTTLIRNLLANAQGRRIALIINEFGDLGVDGEVLRGCGAETCSEADIVELTNGCICCTVAEDFVPTMRKLIERDRAVDHIVIETSGLALPQPLVNAFNWHEIRERVTVDGVVTVVDSRAVADGRFASDELKIAAQRAADVALDHESLLEELFEDQIGCADMIVLNKADLCEAGELAALEHDIAQRTSRAVKTIRVGHGRLPAEILLGLNSAAETDIVNRKSHHELDHESGEEHDHAGFESFVVECGAIADASLFAAGLAKVIARHEILRLKGFAEIAGKPMRLTVQAVGVRTDHYFDRDWRDGERRGSRLVVIGLAGLARERIATEIAALAGE
jgi:cobalamin biosynthesis protein CobW